MKRVFLTFLGVMFFFLCVLIFRPVPILPEEECLVTTGVVQHMFEGGPYDVVFRLEGDQKRYDINRGLENGLDLQTLKNELLGKQVTLKYPDHWTPLDPTKSTIHLSKVEAGEVIVFSEFSENNKGGMKKIIFCHLQG